MEAEEINRACKKACIKISSNSDELIVRSAFRFFHKSNVGLLLIFTLGLSIAWISITMSRGDIIGLLIGLSLGLVISTISLLAILSQITSLFILTKDKMQVRARSKRTSLDLTSEDVIRMKTRVEYVKLKSQPSSGSYFRIVELYLTNNSRNQLFLEFQMDEKDAKLANKLGNEISRMVGEKIDP